MRTKYSLLSVLLFSMMSTSCRPQDMLSVRIVGAPQATSVENQALHLLSEEAGARTGFEWQLSSKPALSQSPAVELTIVAALSSQVPALLPPGLREKWLRSSLPSPGGKLPEGFTVRRLGSEKAPIVVISGNDSRGLLYGVGYLLRKLSMGHGHVSLPQTLDVSTAPQYPVRSHQIGYRFKNNTYDGWTLAMFEQHIRDLAVFGISGLQIIAPHSDDAISSPLEQASNRTPEKSITAGDEQ